MKSSSTIEKAKAALWAKFAGQKDGKGYTPSPQENLLPGVRLEQFQDDLRRGDGKELESKFRAVHSSLTLAFNCFARFKDSPHELRLLGEKGAVQISFEKQLRIFSGGTPPNLDVWVEREGEIIAIESKFLEYFKLSKPKFTNAYERLKSPFSEPCWWDVYKEARQGTAQHLDRAQLIKHYFALRKYQHTTLVTSKLTLHYIFWEPLNWREIVECQATGRKCRPLPKPFRPRRFHSAGRPTMISGKIGAMTLCLPRMRRI